MEDISRHLEMILLFLCLLPVLYQRPLDPEPHDWGRTGRLLRKASFIACAGLVALSIFRFGFGGKVLVSSGGALASAAFAVESIMLAAVGAFALRRLY